MHPRNIYKNPPNFKELAAFYPEFKKYIRQELSGRVTIDYNNKNALKELTRALLKRDFGLDVEIFKERLIPRIPLCLNYILWIEDLCDVLNKNNKPFGIDIGAGCACIYSLLAAKKGWSMLATELDPTNFKCATDNVLKNDLHELISLKLVREPDEILLGVVDEKTNYDFCMCNPPFFDYNEKPQNRTLKRRKIETSASEVSSEVSTKGGEISFIKKLILESSKLKGQVKIYTTLVGKKSDFLLLKKELETVNPKSLAFTEFCQGRTVRWGLAWSFLDLDLVNHTNLIYKNHKQCKSKPPLSLLLDSDETTSITFWLQKIKNILTELKINFNEETINIGCIIYIKAFENTWSHQRKKKRLMARVGLDEKKQDLEKVTDLIKNEIKLGLEKINESPKTKFIITEGLILLKKDKNFFVLEMSWTSGSKECIYQIFQYIKNYFNK